MNRRALVTALALLVGTALAQTEVRWFVGLGAGSDEPTIAPQRAIVDEYNASQNEIELVLEIVDAAQSQDVLATQIAAGNPLTSSARWVFRGAPRSRVPGWT